ncbi:MAG: hypothetical protein EP330_06035 [Deltaproteobacteria bacterium]|nr:MAG: hypothetical protein EP330_06035 [Deltaproteobacteria bacterium]
MLSRQECHDLKTLITAAMMGIEVARTGEAETGHSLATDALRQALDMLSPVEDPSVPTGLRQFE